MAREIESYEREQLEKARRRQAEYEARRMEQAREQYAREEAVLTKQGAAKQEELEQQMDRVPAKYRPQYDKNAVDELVKSRLYAEDAANSGLTNSGLHRLRQTSAGLQRQKADTDTRLEQQAAVDSLHRQIQEYLSEIAQKKQKAESSIYESALKDVMKNDAALQKTAIKNAYAL